MATADGTLGPADLPAAFREIAADAREYTADERAAAIWERAAESGYSRDHLRRLIDEGTIPDASGVDGSRAILRKDLPRKPGHGVAAVCPTVTSSRVQAARAVAGREK